MIKWYKLVLGKRNTKYLIWQITQSLEVGDSNTNTKERKRDKSNI